MTATIAVALAFAVLVGFVRRIIPKKPSINLEKKKGRK